MAFGNPITDGVQTAVGTYGYVVAFDLTAQEIQDLLQVQMQSTAGVMSAPVTAAVDRATLDAYAEDDQTAVDIAYVQEGNVVSVFLRTAAYAFIGTNRIGFWFTRCSQNVTAVESKVDVPQAARVLIKNLILNNLYVTKGKAVPFDVTQAIATARTALGI